MKNRMLSDLIKVCLCVSTVYAPVMSHAATSLNTGGSGGLPPVYPPTTYSDGAGSSDNGKKAGSGNLGNKAAFELPSKPFGTVFGPDKETGGQIYYEGLPNYNHHTFLWKYKDASMKEVIRGSTPSSPAMPGYEMATWDRGTDLVNTFRLRLMQANVKVGELPQFKSATGSTKVPGTVAKAATPSSPEFLYMGEMAAGFERVWARTPDGKIVEGYIDSAGNVAGVKPYVKASPSGGGTTPPSGNGKVNTGGDPGGKAGKFGELWGTDSSGSKIYYEGIGSGGKIFVWKYKDASMKDVLRGTVGTTPGQADYQMATWNRGALSTPAFKSQIMAAGVNVDRMPQENSSTGSAHRAGELAKAATVADPAYFYVGDKDTDGHERVWAFIEKENRYIEGVLGADGQVTSIKTISSTGKPSIAINPLEDAETAKWRPSMLDKTMDWNADKGSAFRRIYMNLRDGIRTNGQGPQNATDMATNIGKLADSKGGQLGMGIAAFYTAMGAVAAYELLMEYPNNPMVLDQYFSKFDAPHVLMFGGFMAFAYPFFRKMPGFTTRGSVIRSAPMFAAGLFAGAVGTVIIQMAADPDVQACTGIPAFMKTGIATSDMQACDRAFGKWNTDTLRGQLVPKLEAMMLTGAITLGIYFAISEQVLAGALRALPFLKGAKPGAIGVVMMIVGGVIWLASDKIANGIFGAEQALSEMNIADSKNEDALFERWEKLRKDGWQEFQPDKSNLPACIIVPFVGIYPRPCGLSNQTFIPFSTLLDNYSNMMTAFRNAQLQKTYDAYNNWSSKVMNYHSQLSASYEVYSTLIQHIQEEMKAKAAGQPLTDSDARGFNETTIRHLERAHINGSVYKADPYASGWELEAGLDKDHVIVSDPVYTQDFSDTWKYIGTRNFYDYAVTSMACGPETEGQSENNILQNIGQFVDDWVTHNTAPKTVVEDPQFLGIKLGEAMIFHPPRLTKPRPGTNRSVCEMAAFTNPLMDMIAKPPSQPPNNFLVLAPWFSGLKDYRNLYEFIKDNVRESVLSSDGKNHFDDWWTNSVMVPAAHQEVLLRQEYEKMLQENYLPTLINQSYYWCEDRDTKSLGFYPYWMMLAPQGPSDCSPTRLHRLGRGLVDSLRDEYRLYMSMVLDLYASHPPETLIYDDGRPAHPRKVAPKALIDQATAQAVAALNAYDQYLFRATDVEGRLRQDADAASDVAEQRLQEFRDNMMKVADGQVESYQQDWMKLLFDKIDPIIKQTKTFYTILKAFEPPTEAELAEGAVPQK